MDKDEINKLIFMVDFVYFATVGKWGDKINRKRIENVIDDEQKNKINDPISFCLFNEIRERKQYPKKVILFSSDDTQQTAEILKEKWDIIRDFEIVKMKNIFDMNYIRKLISKKIKEYNNVTIVFNISGGTKLILSSCIIELFNLIIIGNKINIKFIKGKRDLYSGELVNYDSMETIDIKLEELDHIYKNKIIQGKNHISEGNFADAVFYFIDGQNIKSEEEYTESLFLEKFSRALSYIDSLDFDNSIKLLEEAYKIGQKIDNYNILLKKIFEIKNILKNKNSDEYKKFVIYSFLSSAERIINKNPSMSVLLLYRSFEIFLRFMVSKKFNIDDENLDFERFYYEEIKSKYKDIVFYILGEVKEIDFTKIKKLYLKESLAILIGSGESIIEEFYEKNKVYIKNMIDYRNKNKYIHWFFEKDIEINKLNKFIRNFLNSYKFLLEKVFEDNNRFIELTNLKISI